MKADTRVVRNVICSCGKRYPRTEDRHRRFGTVMPYEPQYTQGWFPVRWDDEVWERCDATDVTSVTPEAEGAISGTAKLLPSETQQLQSAAVPPQAVTARGRLALPSTPVSRGASPGRHRPRPTGPPVERQGVTR